MAECERDSGMDFGYSGNRSVVVLGASGFLGANLCHAAVRDGWEVKGTYRSNPIRLRNVQLHHLDLSDRRSLDSVFAKLSPRLVVNCVALADVEECERQPALAQHLNSWFAEQVAEKCRDLDCALVHISTDAVFAGVVGSCSELTATSPINTYGSSKLDGEELVLRAWERSVVARLSFYGWSPSRDRSILEYFVRGLRSGSVCKGFTDLLFAPISATSVWSSILSLAEHKLWGIQHLCSRGYLSKYEFGVRIARELGVRESLVVAASGVDNFRVPRGGKSFLTTRRTAPLAANQRSLETDLHDLFRAEEQGLRQELSRGLEEN